MPTYLPEGNVPLSTDTPERSLQKINDLLVNQVTLATASEPAFLPDNNLRTHVGVASCVHNGYLVGVDLRPDLHGVIMWNGTGTQVGGKFPTGYATATGGSAYSHLWSHSSGLLVGAVLNPQVVFLTGTLTGQPVISEVWTQSGSGATAHLISYDNTSAILVRISGTWASGVYTCSGSVSGAGVFSTTGLTTDSTNYTAFCASATGLTDFRYFHVDIGQAHTGSVAFVSDVFDDTDYILIVNNVQDGSTQTSKLWINRVDYLLPSDFSAGPMTVLIESDLGSIRHFHGMRAFMGTSDDWHLMIMTGDGGTADSECSILYCNNIHSLITDPGTWKTRFGLDLTGAARNTWFAGQGRPYVLAYGGDVGQYARAVDCVEDDDGRYVYWLPDAPDLTPKYACRVDLTASNKPGSIRYLDGAVRGSGASAARLSDGTILLCSSSESNGVGTFHDDSYCRMYAVSRAGTACFQMVKVNRSNTAVDGGYIDLIKPVEYPVGDGVSLGTVFWDTPKVGIPDTYSMFATGIVCGWIMWTNNGVPESASPLPFVNLIEDGRFFDADTLPRFDNYGTTYISSGAPVAPTTLCTVAKETVYVDTETGGKSSMKLTPTGTGLSSYTFNLAHTAHFNFRGMWMTARVRVLADHTQGARLLINDALAGGFMRTNTASSSWRTLEVLFYVAPGALAFNVTVEGRISGSDTVPTYFSDLVLTPGNHYGRIKANVLPLTALVGARRNDKNGVFYYDVTSADASNLSFESSRARGIVAYGTPGVARVVSLSAYYQVCDEFVLLTNRSNGSTTFKISGRTGFAVAAGKSAFARFDGTDLVRLTADA